MKYRSGNTQGNLEPKLSSENLLMIRPFWMPSGGPSEEKVVGEWQYHEQWESLQRARTGWWGQAPPPQLLPLLSTRPFAISIYHSTLAPIERGETMKLPKRLPGESNKIGLEGRMRCHRCGSIMVYEKYYGLQEHFWGWRCICCGDIVDRIILENRSPMAVGTLRL
jgi:hypothetical protein